jgi:glycolate oxidase
MDGTIPRKQLATMLQFIQSWSKKYQLACPNVFHAGDGNLHPLILFDDNDPDSVRRAEQFGADILEMSVQLGGTVSGEHGIGVEKLDQMCSQFDRDSLSAFEGIKRSFDPTGLLNPGKVVPTLHRCAEYGRAVIRRGQLQHAELPRF